MRIFSSSLRSRVQLTPAAGLVEQHQFGVGHHRCAAELEQFLLPAGQVARALVGDVESVPEGERVVDLLAHRPSAARTLPAANQLAKRFSPGCRGGTIISSRAR